MTVQQFNFNLKEIPVWAGTMDGTFASAEGSRGRQMQPEAEPKESCANNIGRDLRQCDRVFMFHDDLPTSPSLSCEG